MAAERALRLGTAITALLALAGCTGGAGLPPFLSQPPADASTGSVARTVEQDVESPEVFKAAAQGLWDGRPSLGGVWVAHPDVQDPERVIIRNTANGRSVAGALFRREREIPGPPIQVSAEAAAAIGMLAGQPTALEVVALRRVAVEVAPAAGGTATAPVAAAPADGTRPRPRPATAAAPAAAPVVAAPVTAGTAPANPEAADPLAAAARAVAAAEAAAAAPVESRLNRPWLQIGTFSEEANARAAADRLTGAGIAARVADGTHDGNPIWRVLAGPAADRAAMRQLTQQAAALGFADGFPVAR